MNSNVTIIIPTLNEEGSIEEVIREINQEGYHRTIVVDGNSMDKTVKIAKYHGADIIMQRDKGKGAALRQAFDHGNLDGNAVVIMDADGSMNPKEIKLLIGGLNSGNDLVKGSRFLPCGYSEDMSLIRRIGNQFFLLLVNFLWSTNYTDLCYGFAALKKDAVDKLLPYLKSNGFEIETEVFIKAKKLGFSIAEIPSIELRRKHGKSNLRIFRDGFRILATIIRESVSGLSAT